MIIIDVLILTVWSIKDPLLKKFKNVSSELVDDDNDEIIKTFQLEICKSNNMLIWIGMYLTKCILQLKCPIFLKE